MLVSTKHIVMFDDAADDLGRIADMVDNDGAVLMLRFAALAATLPEDVGEDADAARLVCAEMRKVKAEIDRILGAPR